LPKTTQKLSIREATRTFYHKTWLLVEDKQFFIEFACFLTAATLGLKALNYLAKASKRGNAWHTQRGVGAHTEMYPAFGSALPP